jgi:serine/threonine protein kinase
MLGRYHVLDEMGRNAVGALYLARLEGPKGFQRWAAIRKIDKRHLAEDGYVQRFYERVREGAKLLHPNVGALFDIGEDDGIPWVAMEYLHGERVEEVIERLEIADTPASWEIAARIIADAAEGLHAVHNLRDKEGTPLGLLHGDLAPHSLVVTYEGKTKIKGAFEPRAHGVLDPRKVPYAAPEQLFDGAVDARADVFALGVILWELLAGRRLFARRSDDETRAMIEAGVVPPLADIVEDFPAELDDLVRRALTRSAPHRFASARELSRELESLLVAHGVVARDDDVGRYMRTLFADRYTDQEARLQAAADVTEVFRRSQQLPSARTLAAIPDVSVKDEEDAEETELMTSRRSPVSGYTDEIPADSGPTIPRSTKNPQPLLQDTDEVPTVTAPQTPMAAPSSPRRTSGEELTLTSTNPSRPPSSGNARFFMPASLESTHEVTESAIFVAPRARAPTPPERTPTPPPRPAMASFPDRPLLPSTPQAGVSAQPVPRSIPAWPPPPPTPGPFIPPPAFKTPPPSASRGEHAAMSTMSLRAVLFPVDRARRIAVVSIVGSVGGAILFLVFFAIWRVTTSPTTQATPVSPPPPITAKPVALPALPQTSTTAVASVSASLPIPTLDLQQPSSQPSHHHGPRPVPPSTTTTAVTSGKTGYLTVWCKPNPCDHVIDGARDLGASPIFKQEVAVGRHTLTLHVDSTHSQKSVPVDVREGETATIHPDTSQ